MGVQCVNQSLRFLPIPPLLFSLLDPPTHPPQLKSMYSVPRNLFLTLNSCVTLYRVMFWTNWGVREPSIMRARMDGSFVSPAVDIDIVWPNAVTIDQETDTIYWVDAYYHHIESSDMNGKDRRVVLRNGVGPYFILYHGFDVLVKNGFVYWSEWYQNSLYEALLPTGSDRSGNPLNLSVVSRVDDRYFGFTVIDTDAPRRGGKNCTIGMRK